MRIHVALLIGLAVSLVTGCAATRECCHGHESKVREARFTAAEPSPAARPVEVASALLFDPQPARYDAQLFAQRSDWPSTFGYYSPGQVIYFSDRFVDYQGRNWGGLNNSFSSYRRSDSYKVGVGYR